MNAKFIRNFCIIAHIDHGKSTLADRLLERTGLISPSPDTEQVLDSMELEKERGITIKAKAVRMSYRAKDGSEYVLNLIDTPGHVDFSYEVSRSLAACEGAILVVDASSGVEAQTLANYYLAMEHDLAIIPVINKIDLPSADIESTKRQMEEILALDSSSAIPISAKEGIGVDEVLEAIISRIPPPRGNPYEPLRALVFDSTYDPYRGVIVFVRVMDGRIAPGMKIEMMASGRVYEVGEVGVFELGMRPVDQLSCGEVGYVIAGIKKTADVRIGDTITDAGNPAREPLPGYKEMKPMVFCSLYPVNNADYQAFRDALEKLHLSDASFVFEPESSQALGFGFRCGFLGMLHMEIVQERLEREYGLNLIATVPSVAYRIRTRKGEEIEVSNPSKFPQPGIIEKIEEPYVRVQVVSPTDYVGEVMSLMKERRGELIGVEYPGESKAIFTFDMPLSEMITDFYDKLKSRTRGYASMDYEVRDYRPSDLVKVDILLNGQMVEGLSFIAHRERAYHRARSLVEKLKELIPRHLFEVAIQAAIGSKVIARETIRPLRKDVTAKCYGGDVTRKRKLLEKQKEGKKRMKKFGKVEVPQEAFLAVLKI